jgi:hypothetical protein
MKVKIIKKSIKEGDNYCIKSLFCSVDNKEDANKLAMAAIESGATKEQVGSLIKAGTYEEKVTYAFGLNCSNFTFDRVERFGILDADIIFIKTEKNGNTYFNAKIQIIDKKEQIHGYEAPAPREDEADGWATPAPEIKQPQPYGDGSKGEPNPIDTVVFPVFDPSNPNDTGLPF